MLLLCSISIVPSRIYYSTGKCNAAPERISRRAEDTHTIHERKKCESKSLSSFIRVSLHCLHHSTNSDTLCKPIAFGMKFHSCVVLLLMCFAFYYRFFCLRCKSMQKCFILSTAFPFQFAFFPRSLLIRSFFCSENRLCSHSTQRVCLHISTK